MIKEKYVINIYLHASIFEQGVMVHQWQRLRLFRTIRYKDPVEGSASGRRRCGCMEVVMDQTNWLPSK